MEYLQHAEAIPCILPRKEQNGRRNNRWREFDPQVTLHYAHANSLLLVTRERPPWVQSPVHFVAISACRAPSHPRWAVIGGEHVKQKKHANKLRTSIGRHHGNLFPVFLRIDGDFYEMRLTDTSVRRAAMDDVCSASGMCGGRMAESDRWGVSAKEEYIKQKRWAVGIARNISNPSCDVNFKEYQDY